MKLCKSLFIIAILAAAAFAQGIQPGPGLPNQTGGGGGITSGNVSTAQPAAYYDDSITHAHNNDGDYLIVDYFHGVVGTDAPTSVTYNGVAMTQLASQAVTGYGGRQVTRFGLVNPAAGVNNVVLTFASDGLDGVLIVHSYGGVNQTTPTGTTVTVQGGSGDTVTVNAASASGEIVVDALLIAFEADSMTVTAGAGQTESANLDSTGIAGTYVGGAVSRKNGETTTTMTWTQSAAKNWALLATPLKPA